MSSATELKIAEMLNEGKTYREIAKKLHTSADTIKKIRDQAAKGIILIDDKGKAFLAKPAQKDIEEIHSQVMDVVTRKATELALLNAEEDYAMGNEIRQYWSVIAKEDGRELREYVKSALMFYDEFRDKIEELEEIRKVSQAVMDTLRHDTLRATKMELYYKFVRYCLHLKSQGMIIPSQVIVDFYRDLSLLEKGEEIVRGQKIV